MAILIDMPMPSKCLVCPCAYWTEGAHHDYCQAVGYDTELLYDLECRPSWCPLIEVHIPTRNADMDKLMQDAGWE